MGVAVPSLAILAETQNLEAQLLPGPFFFLSLFFLVAFVFFCLLFLLSCFSFCSGARGQTMAWGQDWKTRHLERQRTTWDAVQQVDTEGSG